MSVMSDQGTPQTPQDWQKLWQEKVQFENVYAEPKAPGQVPYGLGGYEMRYPYAGWWLRVIATFVDGFLILVFEALVLAAAWAAGAKDPLLIASGFGLVPYLWFQWRNGSTGQSPGKRVLHLRVVHNETGEPIGGPMGLLRWLAGWAISALTCGIGGLVDLLWPIFDDKKRTLHDMIVGSVVISGQRPGS
jgi:uncharacterized RDD family membrane protein YckC